MLNCLKRTKSNREDKKIVKNMRKPALCLLAALLLLVGCQKAATMSPPEQFEMAGQKVTFAPPPESWGNKKVTAMPHEGAQKDSHPDTVVSYDPAWDGASLTISGLSGWQQDSWEADQEATNAFTRQIQDQVLKRTNGEIVNQRQSTLGDEPALELEVRYQEASKMMHGKQIYAIHNHAMWIVSLNVPEEHWRESNSVYSQLVASWKFN